MKEREKDGTERTVGPDREKEEAARVIDGAPPSSDTTPAPGPADKSENKSGRKYYTRVENKDTFGRALFVYNGVST